MQTVDLAVVGAGAVGMTFAAAMRNKGFKIAMLDGKANLCPSPQAAYDSRVFALTRASERIFESVGAWKSFERNSPFQNMEVWENNGQIQFFCDELGEPNLGYITELWVILRALAQTLQTSSDIQFFTDSKITSLEFQQNQYFITLESGETLNAKLVIGADGANSKVRELAGISLNSKEYNHHALVATVQTELPHQMTARQRFLGSSILAFLPLSEPHICSIVWSVPPNQAKDLLKLSVEEFNQLLSTSFAHKLGEVSLISERFIFPLIKRHAMQYVKPHLALMGDAAHTIHPLAGQGMNLGLLDAASLAELLLQHRNRPLGDFQTLRRYERWRKTETTTMMTAMGSFKYLFGSDFLPLKTIRNWGLNMSNQNAFFKRVAMNHAMGLSGNLPQLAMLSY
jgi:2-polyprenylphenol 6-hydroxylase